MIQNGPAATRRFTQPFESFDCHLILGNSTLNRSKRSRSTAGKIAPLLSPISPGCPNRFDIRAKGTPYIPDSSKRPAGLF
jgi:hypothetical protein